MSFNENFVINYGFLEFKNRFKFVKMAKFFVKPCDIEVLTSFHVLEEAVKSSEQQTC